MTMQASCSHHFHVLNRGNRVTARSQGRKSRHHLTSSHKSAQWLKTSSFKQTADTARVVTFIIFEQGIDRPARSAVHSRWQSWLQIHRRPTRHSHHIRRRVRPPPFLPQVFSPSLRRASRKARKEERCRRPPACVRSAAIITLTSQPSRNKK